MSQSDFAVEMSEKSMKKEKNILNFLKKQLLHPASNII